MKLSDIVNSVVIDSRKLTDYALDPDAPWGRRKAAAFKELLGFTQENYTDLQTQIKDKALQDEVTLHSEDAFGRRYTVDLLISGTEGRQAVVRTGWLVSLGDDEARLVTLYIVKKASRDPESGR